MEIKQQKSKRRKERLSINNRNGLVIGSITATLIAITPYLFYLHESVPDVKVWNTFLFTYDSKAWESAQYAMWVMTSKLLPLFLLFIWFFTCRHWWYHTILVPIAMYIFQIINCYCYF